MMKFFLTWDIAIVSSLAILLAFSIIIHRAKALAILVGLYISFYISSVWGVRIAQFFAGNRVLMDQIWIKSSISTYMVQSILLFVITILLAAFLKLGGKRSKYSIVEVTLYSICAVALALVFIVSFMPMDVLQINLEHSYILPIIYHWREWILILPVFVMVFFGIYSDEN